MAGELVEAASILAGSGVGGWFGNQVFGPSVGAVGDQLKVYLQSRVPTIFGVAEQKLAGRDADLNPIPPGLLARMVADASFSDADPEITEWWANLFIDASISNSNRHVVFSDIMAMLGPAEVKCLESFMTQFDYVKDEKRFLRTMSNMIGTMDMVRDEAVGHWVGITPIPADRLHVVRSNLMSGQTSWPYRPIRWSLPMLHDDQKPGKLNQINPWFGDNQEAIEILERARVLKYSRVDIPVIGPSSWVDGIEMTGIGASFYAACKGHDWDQK